MRRTWQKEWLGIDFKSFAALNSKKIADVFFYDKFYEEFYKKFSFYEEFPLDWKQQKRLIANFILEQTNDEDKILSIGCGNGYIEYLLITKEGLIKVFKDAGFDDVESDFLNRTKRIFWIRGC